MHVLIYAMCPPALARPLPVRPAPRRAALVLLVPKIMLQYFFSFFFICQCWKTLCIVASSIRRPNKRQTCWPYTHTQTHSCVCVFAMLANQNSLNWACYVLDVGHQNSFVVSKVKSPDLLSALAFPLAIGFYVQAAAKVILSYSLNHNFVLFRCTKKMIFSVYFHWIFSA